jgi:hypothetical protein
MDSVQAARGDSLRNGAVRQAGRGELSDRDRSVLARRNPEQRKVGCVDFL